MLKEYYQDEEEICIGAKHSWNSSIASVPRTGFRSSYKQKKEDITMSGIERVCQFLDEVQTYYLATVEGDQPRVRAFGTSLLFDGKLYIQTGKVKEVSKQIAANPKVEICAFNGEKWLRLTGELVNDDNHDAKVAMREKMPAPSAMYSADDDNMQMLYITNATATFSSFTEAPETITL